MLEKVSIMSEKTVITTTAIDSGIVAIARRSLVKAAKGTGEVIQGYADALCMVHNVRALDTGAALTPWYELRGKDAKGVKAERALFVTDMTEAGFGKGTVDVYWQRVKEASGYVTAGNRVKGASDTDGKTAAELKTIINRILKAEEDGEDCHASTILETLKDAYIVLTGERFDAKK
jgi:hypothetical protein